MTADTFHQCIRPAEAIETPSETNQQEETEMSIHSGKTILNNGRDDEVIESLLEGKAPEGYVEVRSDIDDCDEGEVTE